MSQQSESTCNPPATSTFSFTAPFPPTSHPKQRRVSLALPSSPRLVPAWSFRDDTGLYAHGAGGGSDTVPEKKGKMRKIAGDDGECSEADRLQDAGDDKPREKRARKKWTMEETRMLVEGCNAWGVGNWKAILKDPKLKFDNRSPVDLKDRFRTYFPDAYKHHYPNAKTHLSSKVRSILPNGTSIFEKTRSKKRRPFTEEEDKALKAGYEKHGTVWAAIVKDPVFQEHNRRSTDLRDRFRNAFPELYEAAGYKPRRTMKRKKGEESLPIRAATDDQIASGSTVGAARRKRATEGLFRGGTKSVPQSVANSEDEDSSGEEDDTDVLSPQPPSSSFFDSDKYMQGADDASPEADMIDSLAEPLSIHDYLPDASQTTPDSSQSQNWSSGFDTPIHSNTWATATTAGSPTSSHLSSEYFLHQSSPFERRGDSMNMIGKSAWGTQDWFSPNPRLDPSSSSSSSFIGGLSPTPSSPFSFHQLSHGVLDRYDLFPTSFPNDFASEVGVGDAHSTFSDPEMFTSNFRGFTHHSDYAGDLIFGTRAHQSQHMNYGAGFGFGNIGLGLSGMQQPTSVHPLQLHTPGLPQIDEIGLTSISLDDQPEASDNTMETGIDVSTQTESHLERSLSMSDFTSFELPRQTLEEIVGLSHTPPATPVNPSRSLRTETNAHHSSYAHSRSVSVPPSEHRSLSRPSQALPYSKAPSTPTRHFSFYDSFLQQGEEPPFRLTPTFASPSELFRAPNDRDVPFLDLHYYSSSSHGGVHSDSDGDSAILRQGQALDLAQPLTAPKSPATIPPLPHFPSQNTAASRVHSNHHRGQSAVSPQDLLLHNCNDNKRKRASWDGGPS